jgi:Transposase DDE domain
VPFSIPQPTPQSFDTLLRSFAQGDGLTTAPLLDEHDIQDACDQLGVAFAPSPDEVWTPALTLWAFLWQVLSPAKSCVAAVARALVWRLASGLAPCSANTGAYCKARQKLPERLLSGLALEVADRLEREAPAGWLWHGRHVHVLDGNVVTAADTPANQAEYPQPACQAPGLGFPLLRWVALFSLATGAVTAAALSAWQGKRTGETTLARAVFGRLRPGDLVVGDRVFATFWLIAAALAQQAEVVCRLHAHRCRQGHSRSSRLRRVLGHQDQVLLWCRPRRPEWLDEAGYAQLPEQLEVRVCWRRVDVPGFRTQEVTVVTTLLDAEAYPADEVVGLYRLRWQAELNLRTLKQTLKMEHLACKTPAMVRKELWAHVLGYNLVRGVLAQAGRAQGVRPTRLSMAGALQTLAALRELLTWLEGERREGVLRALGVALCQHRIGDRPDRVEPRRLKRGPKPYPRLRQHRHEARAALRAGAAQP